MLMQKFLPRRALGAVIATLCLTAAPAALAAKGGGGSTGGGGGGTSSGSNISLVMVKDLNGNGLPNWGDTVTFDVSTTVTYPEVELECFQKGVVVLRQGAGFFPAYMWSKDFSLESSRWTGGAADCLAALYYTTKNGTARTLATLSFPVEA